MHPNKKKKEKSTGSAADTYIQFSFNRHVAAACQEGMD